MNELAKKRALEWVSSDYYSEESKAEIRQLLDSGNDEEITNRFYKDIEFGTGGMRAIIGEGQNMMNKYTVRRATQALANTINKNFKNEENAVAISYDSRKYSFEFAKESAAVLAGNGIKSYIFKKLNPTPILSFAVRYFSAKAGIMVTASHNPSKYNGYKAYWQTGCQVTPPYDQEIVESYNQIEDLNTIKVKDFDEALDQGMIEWVKEDLLDAYHESITPSFFNIDLNREKGKELSVVLTPLHGTGLESGLRVLNEKGPFDVKVVEEQKDPDSTFSTVSSPNPESPEAMKMAVDLMLAENAHLAFGTDPDADRLGIVVNHNKVPFYLNGNQVGVLFLYYILSQRKERGLIKSSSIAIKTIVTSELQKKICDSFNVKMYSTLTGFKWIGDLLDSLRAKDPETDFIFASEESYGYLTHDCVRDKDAIGTLGLASEMALHYKLKGMDLVEVLDMIYVEYGFFHESLLCLTYEGKAGADKIIRIMDYFRNYSEKEICEEKIDLIEDYSRQEILEVKTGNKKILELPKSNVIGFKFESGQIVYLRPSGTEPKIKFYFLLQEDKGTLDEKKERVSTKSKVFEKYFSDVCEGI